MKLLIRKKLNVPNGKVLRGVRITALSIVAWFLLSYSAARLLVVHAELKSADAIVVFSGSATYNERIDRAAQLYRDGRAGRIILTDDRLQGGWSTSMQRNPFSFERGFQRLTSGGVPAASIKVLHEPVSSTYDEAKLLRIYALENGFRSLLFVTSGYHSRRALWTLRQVFQGSHMALGLDAVPTGIQTPSPATWWLRPRGWRTVPVEYVKIVYYWLQFR